MLLVALFIMVTINRLQGLILPASRLRISRWNWMNYVSRQTMSSSSKDVKSMTKGLMGLSLKTIETSQSDDLFYHELVSHITNTVKNGELVPHEYLQTLLEKSIIELKKEKNVIKVARLRDEVGAVVGKVTICGDTHGQYKDFLKIFSDNVAGSPSLMSKFIFNGDIADRGPQAVEIFTVLLSMKLLAPDAVHILRGNHETEEMTARFGFQKEVLRKYDYKMWGLFRDLFDALPPASVVDDQIFVVHGGLGQKTSTMTIDELQEFNRFTGFETSVELNELLWADPREMKGDFSLNIDRGGGVVFGPSVTEQFLENNKLSLLVRSHEMMKDGFNVMHNRRLITIFSAPNYCGVWKNKGAVLQLSGKEEQVTARIIQFEADNMESKVERLKRERAAEWDML